MATRWPAGGRLRFAELIDHEFVCFERSSSVETLCQQAAAELGRTMKLSVRVGGFDAQLRMVGTGLGVGTVPRPVAVRAVPEAGIGWVTLDEAWARRPLNTCVSSRSELPVAAWLLLKHLTARRPPAALPPRSFPFMAASLDAAPAR